MNILNVFIVKNTCYAVVFIKINTIMLKNACFNTQFNTKVHTDYFAFKY